MNTYLTTHHQQFALEAHLSPAHTIITFGRNTEEAYNVIALDDPTIDTFQCQFSHTTTGWKIHNGQWRTDCPKGIHSRLQHACNLCMGRCVNTHPGRPTYGWRTPQHATLLNGQAIPPEGIQLNDGDMIAAGEMTLKVKIAE